MDDGALMVGGNGPTPPASMSPVPNPQPAGSVLPAIVGNPTPSSPPAIGVPRGPGKGPASAPTKAALDSLISTLVPGGLPRPIEGGSLNPSALRAITDAVKTAPAATLDQAEAIIKANPGIMGLFHPQAVRGLMDALQQNGQAAQTGSVPRETVGQPMADIPAVSKGPVGDGSADAPVQVQNPEDMDVARQRVDTDPTDHAKKTGRYQKGYADVNGMVVAIENPKGSVRTGTDADGKSWATVMPADYGHVARTTGADGDAVDAYIGPHIQSQSVHVIDQIHPKTGEFDEHKGMVGYPDQESALADYNRSFSDGSAMSRVGNVTTMPLDTFHLWAKEGDTQSPVAGQALPKTVADIHHLADDKGIAWDNDPDFMNTVKKLTGREHLDDLNMGQLQKVHNAVKAFQPKPIEQDAPAQEIPSDGPSPSLIATSEQLRRTGLAQDVAAIANRVTGGAAKLKPGDISDRGGPAMVANPETRLVAGRYNPLSSLIATSVAPQFNPKQPEAHESWDWMKQNGIFKPRELAAMHNGRPMMENMVKADGLDPTHMSTEEIEATAFARFKRLQDNGDNPYGVPPPIRGAFQKAIRFFSELSSRVKRYGFGQPDRDTFKTTQMGVGSDLRSPISRFGAPAALPTAQPVASNQQGAQ